MNVLALYQDESKESGKIPHRTRVEGIKEATAVVSRLGLLLHFARRTYSNRFAGIRARQKVTREGTGIYIGNAYAVASGRNRAAGRGDNFSRKIEIMAQENVAYTVTTLLLVKILREGTTSGIIQLE